MTKQYINLECLSYFCKKMKEYVDMKIELGVNKRVNCPNCGAPITSMKCEYCGTDFEKGILI